MFDNISQKLDSPGNHLLNSKNMFTKIDHPFLIAAVASLLVSVGLWFLVNRDYGVFVGLWVPSILGLWVGVRLVLLANAVARRSIDV